MIERIRAHMLRHEIGEEVEAIAVLAVYGRTGVQVLAKLASAGEWTRVRRGVYARNNSMERSISLAIDRGAK